MPWLTPRLRATAFGLPVLAAVVAGCGPGEGTVHSAQEVAQHLAERFRGAGHDLPVTMPDGLPAAVPRDLPAVRAGDLSRAEDDAVQQVTAVVRQDTDGLDTEQARAALGAACRAKDWYETGQATSWEEAVDSAITDNGGNATFKRRVLALARDLRDTDDSKNAADKIAVFVLCESVG
jgi:hypothetical protein